MVFVPVDRWAFASGSSRMTALLFGASFETAFTSAAFTSDGRVTSFSILQVPRAADPVFDIASRDQPGLRRGEDSDLRVSARNKVHCSLPCASGPSLKVSSCPGPCVAASSAGVAEPTCKGARPKVQRGAPGLPGPRAQASASRKCRSSRISSSSSTAVVLVL